MSDANGGSTGTECPACGAASLVTVAEIEGIPVHVGVLWPTAKEARESPRGDMRLVFCDNCGFLHNAAFDESLVDYGLSYDNALHFSEVFQVYEKELAEGLIDRYDLREKLIVEIGCGSAHFLGLLCQLGDNRGLGFDPSHEPEHLDDLAVGRVEVRREYFDESSGDVEADLVCARHLLEHIEDPLGLLRSLRRTLDGSETTLYFEVPNALLALEQLSIWDLMYEHCGYFTTGSLGRLFRRAGFEVLDVREEYGNQFVGIEARPGEQGSATMSPGEKARMHELVSSFSDHLDSALGEWNARLEQLAGEGRRIVVWGAGGKGVSFMNFLSSARHVDALVDVNPRKQGMYLAGSGHEIIAPEALVERRPDVVVVMNPLYENEIASDLRSMGLETAEVTVAV